jgi:hypothetical protein
MNYSAAEQMSANWCWAACIQMVLSTRGLDVQQQEIVERAFGRTVDAPAGPTTIVQNLNGWTIRRDAQLTPLNATIGLGPPPIEVLISSLNKETPIIIGMPPVSGYVGHASVVTAIVYQDTPDGRRLHSVMVRDPDPAYRSDQGKRKLSPDEFSEVEDYVLVTELASP